MAGFYARARHEKIFQSYFGFFLTAIMFAACGAGTQESNANKQKEIDDRAALLSTLQPLTGVYEGEVSNDSRGSYPFPVELTVFLVDEPNGVNEDGELKFRPALRARYRRPDYPLDSSSERNLTARYYAESRTFTFVSLTAMGMASPASDPNYLSLSGRIEGFSIVGELRNQRGVLGHFTLKRVRQ